MRVFMWVVVAFLILSIGISGFNDVLTCETWGTEMRQRPKIGYGPVSVCVERRK